MTSKGLNSGKLHFFDFFVLLYLFPLDWKVGKERSVSRPFQAPACATVPCLDRAPISKIWFDRFGIPNIDKSCQTHEKTRKIPPAKYFGYH